MFVGVFFFFKQKTAYEMRISDWSSDVCSSDLIEHDLGRRIDQRGIHTFADQRGMDALAAPQRNLALGGPAACQHGNATEIFRADRTRHATTPSTVRCGCPWRTTITRSCPAPAIHGRAFATARSSPGTSKTPSPPQPPPTPPKPPHSSAVTPRAIA